MCKNMSFNFRVGQCVHDVLDFTGALSSEQILELQVSGMLAEV